MRLEADALARQYLEVGYAVTNGIDKSGICVLTDCEYRALNFFLKY